MANLPDKLIQRVYSMFQATPTGETALRTISTTPTPLFGQAKIATTGVAIQLASNALTNGVIITAKSTNSAPILVGGSSVANVSDGTGGGYILEAGGSVSFACQDMSDLWINGTSGDIVSMAGS